MAREIREEQVRVMEHGAMTVFLGGACQLMKNLIIAVTVFINMMLRTVAMISGLEQQPFLVPNQMLITSCKQVYWP